MSRTHRFSYFSLFDIVEMTSYSTLFLERTVPKLSKFWFKKGQIPSEIVNIIFKMIQSHHFPNFCHFSKNDFKLSYFTSSNVFDPQIQSQKRVFSFFSMHPIRNNTKFTISGHWDNIIGCVGIIALKNDQNVSQMVNKWPFAKEFQSNHGYYYTNVSFLVVIS